MEPVSRVGSGQHEAMEYALYRIDLLLGVDICADSILQGQRKEPIGSPVAFETSFGCLLARPTNYRPYKAVSCECHLGGWYSEEVLGNWGESPSWVKSLPWGTYGCSTFNTFTKVMHVTKMVVPLPKDPESKPLRESRMQAVCRFRSLERSLHSKNQFAKFAGHAKVVPDADMQNPSKNSHSDLARSRVVYCNSPR